MKRVVLGSVLALMSSGWGCSLIARPDPEPESNPSLPQLDPSWDPSPVRPEAPDAALGVETDLPDASDVMNDGGGDEYASKISDAGRPQASDDLLLITEVMYDPSGVEPKS